MNFPKGPVTSQRDPDAEDYESLDRVPSASEKLVQHVQELVHLDAVKQQELDSAPVHSLPAAQNQPTKTPAPQNEVKMSISGLQFQNLPSSFRDGLRTSGQKTQSALRESNLPDPDADFCMSGADVEKYFRSATEESPSARAIKSAHRKVFVRSFPKENKSKTPNDQGHLTLKIEGRGKLHGDRSRSAGKVPPRAKSVDRATMIQRQKEMLRKSPSIQMRTPPSIPSTFNAYSSRQPKGCNAYSMEHEAHARVERSPRKYMEKSQSHPQSVILSSSPLSILFQSDCCGRSLHQLRRRFSLVTWIQCPPCELSVWSMGIIRMENHPLQCLPLASQVRFIMFTR